MRKKLLSLFLSALLISAAFGTAVFAAEVDTSGEIVDVTAETAQDVLDGRYGDISGKTINFTENVDVVLDLARPTKYEGSKTVYYNQTGDDPVTDISSLSNHARYFRTLESVKFTADEGITVAGFTYSAGHVASSGFDYVKDIEQTTGITYYDFRSLNNITFENLTIKDEADFKLYAKESSVSNIIFDGCTFLGNAESMKTNGYEGIHMLADDQYFDNVTITNCSISNYYQGIYISGVNGAVISNNNIDNTTHNAVALQSYLNPVKGTVDVKENYISNATDRAVRFGNIAEANITLNNNVMVNSGDKAGELIKPGTIDASAVIDLEHNYWNGSTIESAVIGFDVATPKTSGITGGKFSQDVSSYVADGYDIKQNEDGTFDVVQENYVASIGDKKYTSLEDALKEATDGSVIKILSDINLTEMIKIENDIIIEGSEKYTITSSANKAFEVYSNVTFKNLEIINTANLGRCIDTRTDNIEVIIDNVYIETTGSGNNQTLTIGGTDLGGLTVKLQNNSVIKAGRAGYGIIVFVPVDLTVDTSEILGYSALYMKAGSANSVIAAENSKLSGTNVHKAGSSDFGTIVFEENNINLTIDENSAVESISTADSVQAVIMFKNYQNTVAINGTVSTTGTYTVLLDGFENSIVNVGEKAAEEFIKAGYAIDENGRITGNAFEYLLDGIIYEADTEKFADVAFNAFYANFDTNPPEKYGMWLFYTEDGVNKGQKVEVSNTKETDNGWFNAVIEEIPEANFDTWIVCVPYVVLSGDEVITGNLTLLTANLIAQ